MDNFNPENFLGLTESKQNADIHIVQLPYEMTTSYGQGTGEGPKAFIEASAQVELFDVRLGKDLPAGLKFSTVKPWESEAPTLRKQLDSMAVFASQFYTGESFPLFIGGEHGILPPIISASRNHPLVSPDLSNLTIVQIDAHADLRESLDDEPLSHACAASRSLDLGIGSLIQIGIRAFSQQEYESIKSDDRISTHFARNLFNFSTGQENWSELLSQIKSISGPVHLTVDIDGLDGTLVPATGTPVPGGLNYWQLDEILVALFEGDCTVISADINEIVEQNDTPLTQFSAALIGKRIVSEHIIARATGRWEAVKTSIGERLKVDVFEEF